MWFSVILTSLDEGEMERDLLLLMQCFLLRSKSFLEVWNIVSTYPCWEWDPLLIRVPCLQVATSLVCGVCLSEKLWRKMWHPSWNISNSFGVAGCNGWSNAWSSSRGRICEVEPFLSFIFSLALKSSEENNCSFFLVLVLDPEIWTKERKSQRGLFSLQCASLCFPCIMVYWVFCVGGKPNEEVGLGHLSLLENFLLPGCIVTRWKWRIESNQPP